MLSVCLQYPDDVRPGDLADVLDVRGIACPPSLASLRSEKRIIRAARDLVINNVLTRFAEQR